MSTEVTHWISLLQAGDADAAQPLWERYFRRLVGLARERLRKAHRRAADEEDVALSAFDSFCRGALAGRFPRLKDADELWRLLVVITARKAADLLARDRCQKRGGGQVRGESALLGPPERPDARRGIEEVVGGEPTPAFAAQVAEQCQVLLGALPDESLRTVALCKMEGYTNQEVADRLDCSLATVERKLALIRRLWEREGG
jgi:DNA-directed RNA polymerase specialized sigma24 family protein